MITPRTRTLARNRFRPFLRRLETRDTPTVFTVTNTLDAGPGSLRQAVIDANNLPGLEEDVIDASGVTGTIVLTSGQLTVTAPEGMTIIGSGATHLTVSGNKQGRILDISPAKDSFKSVAITVTGLTLTAGEVAGPGGAILCSTQHLTLTDCVLEANTAKWGIAGDPTPTGGAVSVTSGGWVTATNCTFSKNVAQMQGGAIDLRGGGAKDTVITHCTISGNSSTAGGGVYCVGFLVLDGCTVSNNKAASFPTGNGGGVVAVNGPAPGAATIRNSTIANNTADTSGGGIAFYNFGPSNQPFLVENSTISDNAATAAHGGGISVWTSSTLSNAPTLIRNSTIAFNTSSSPGSSGQGGGIAAFGSAAADITLQSSVVAKNNNGLAPDVWTSWKLFASNSATYSATGIATFVDLGGNRPFGEDPMLAQLGNYGGPTPTHALIPGSPLIDAGANPAGLTTDQRGAGFARVANGQADIGAFEAQSGLPFVTSVVLNGGAAQRSMVTELAVTFSEPVSFPSGLAAAFQFARTGPGGPTGAVNLSLAQTGNEVTATFAPGGAVGVDPGGSLTDGNFTLTVVSSKVQGAFGLLDGNGDGTAGDDYVQAGGPASPSRLFRLFGDADGNGSVDAADFAGFRTAFGDPSEAFDFDGDGDVDAADFGQFRQRFGVSLP